MALLQNGRVGFLVREVGSLFSFSRRRVLRGQVSMRWDERCDLFASQGCFVVSLLVLSFLSVLDWEAFEDMFSVMVRQSGGKVGGVICCKLGKHDVVSFGPRRGRRILPGGQRVLFVVGI